MFFLQPSLILLREKSKTEISHDHDHQKSLIESLALAEKESRSRFDTLRKAIEAGEISRDEDPANHHARDAPPDYSHGDAAEGGFGISTVARPSAQTHIDPSTLTSELSAYNALILSLINDIKSFAGDIGSENLQLAKDIRLAYDHKSIIPRLEGLYKQNPIDQPTMEVPHDSYVPSADTGLRAQDVRMASLQSEIDSTVGTMRDNINKISGRGHRLDSLEDTTDDLATNAQAFRRGANEVRKQTWWRDMRMRYAIIVMVLLALTLVMVLYALYDAQSRGFSSPLLSIVTALVAGALAASAVAFLLERQCTATRLPRRTPKQPAQPRVQSLAANLASHAPSGSPSGIKERYDLDRLQRASGAGTQSNLEMRSGHVHAESDMGEDELPWKEDADSEEEEAAPAAEYAPEEARMEEVNEVMPYAVHFDLEDITTPDEVTSQEEDSIVGRLLREWTTLGMDNNQDVTIPITATD